MRAWRKASRKCLQTGLHRERRSGGSGGGGNHCILPVQKNGLGVRGKSTVYTVIRWSAFENRVDMRVPAEQQLLKTARALAEQTAERLSALRAQIVSIHIQHCNTRRQSVSRGTVSSAHHWRPVRPRVALRACTRARVCEDEPAPSKHVLLVSAPTIASAPSTPILLLAKLSRCKYACSWSAFAIAAWDTARVCSVAYAPTSNMPARARPHERTPGVRESALRRTLRALVS